MALGTFVLKIGEAEVGTFQHDLPEDLEATVDRDGQTLTVTLAPKAKPKRTRKPAARKKTAARKSTKTTAKK